MTHINPATSAPRYTVRTWSRVALWGVYDSKNPGSVASHTFRTRAEAESKAGELNREDHSSHGHLNSYDEETCEALGAALAETTREFSLERLIPSARRVSEDCRECDGTGQKVVDHSGAVMIETCECSAGVTR